MPFRPPGPGEVVTIRMGARPGDPNIVTRAVTDPAAAMASVATSQAAKDAQALKAWAVAAGTIEQIEATRERLRRSEEGFQLALKRGYLF